MPSLELSDMLATQHSVMLARLERADACLDSLWKTSEVISADQAK